MKLLLCTTFIVTAFLGAYADLNIPQASVSENSVVQEQDVPVISLELTAGKQAKQSLFGAQIDVNLNKNGTLIPVPSFINLNTGWGSGYGVGGSLVVPLAFPLSLLFPSAPPLNLTLGFTSNKNLSFSLNAGAGDISSLVNNGTDNNTDDSTSTSTPPTTPGWTPPTTTSGWAPPSTTPGWAAPTTTSGWVAPSSTPGWAPSETTPGWGSGWKKDDE